MNTLKNFILHASLIQGIGPKTIDIITNKYTDTESNFYTFCIDDFVKRGVARHKAETLYSQLKNKELIDNELHLLKMHNTVFLTPYEQEYPKELKTQETYPSVLYQQKNNTLININDYISLSIVSSRETNSYGKKVISKIIEELTDQNIIIVSGGAIGGDTYIHEAALANNLKTIAVIGSGLAHWYPKNNESLFKKIINCGGIIMSHFPINTLASKATFPIRNSIIAGISKATLIIQAGIKSGTLITANYALEYGKEVGAIPGYIDDIVMIESNNLIKQGAHCITSGKDILSMLNIEPLQNLEIKKNTIHNNNDTLSEQEIKIVNLCVETISINELHSILNINIDTLYNQLFLLMEKNYIQQDFMGHWIKK